MSNNKRQNKLWNINLMEYYAATIKKWERSLYTNVYKIYCDMEKARYIRVCTQSFMLKCRNKRKGIQEQKVNRAHQDNAGIWTAKSV